MSCGNQKMKFDLKNFCFVLLKLTNCNFPVLLQIEKINLIFFVPPLHVVSYVSMFSVKSSRARNEL